MSRLQPGLKRDGEQDWEPRAACVKMVASFALARHGRRPIPPDVLETGPADTRNDQVRALGVRAAVCADGGVAGGAGRPGEPARVWDGNWCGSWWRWWGRGRRRWHSTALLDAEIDARNPRTRCGTFRRECLSTAFAWGFVALSSLVFLYAARELNALCFELAPVALGVIFFYSFTKRFTAFSHLVLGSRWGSRRRRLGSRCGDRSIRAFCGSRPR